jgi:ABC-type branched-subunit amino acid transport system substrate-binding protein
VPDIFAGAEVAAENINAAGGVNGRPLEVVTCNGKADPKAELACARKGISENVIASAGSTSLANSPGVLEITDRAGIADVAGAVGAPEAASLPTMFPIDFIAASANGCVSPTAVNAVGGDAKIGVASAENPFAAGVFSLMEPYLKSPAVGDKYAGAVTVGATQQDLGPIVQDLDDKGANYIEVNIFPSVAAQLVSAAASAGKKWAFCGDGGLFGPQILRQLAPQTNGFLTSVGYPPANSGDKYPLIKQFVEEMKAAEEAGNKDANLDVNHVNALRAWLGMHIVKQVAEGIHGEVTKESFLKAMNTAKVDLGWAQVDFSKPLGQPPFERVFQPNMFIAKWNTDTKQLDEVGEVNVLKTLAG